MTIQNNRIPEVKAAVEQGIKVGLTAAGMGIHGQAVMLAPVLTGNLKGSLSWTIGGKVGGLNDSRGGKPKDTPKNATPSDGVRASTPSDVVYVGTNVEYAQRVEYRLKTEEGVTRSGGYLRPAYDIMKDRIPRLMGKDIRRILQQRGLAR